MRFEVTGRNKLVQELEYRVQSLGLVTNSLLFVEHPKRSYNGTSSFPIARAHSENIFCKLKMNKDCQEQTARSF